MIITFTETINKVALICEDDKRVIQKDGIHTLTGTDIILLSEPGAKRSRRRRFAWVPTPDFEEIRRDKSLCVVLEGFISCFILEGSIAVRDLSLWLRIVIYILLWFGKKQKSGILPEKKTVVGNSKWFLGHRKHIFH